MKRRAFITLLGGATAIARPKGAFTQTTDKMPRVAVLLAGNEADPDSAGLVTAFEQGMRRVGWTKNVNVRLFYRWGGTDTGHAAAAAAEVASWNPTVIVAVGSPVVIAMQRATAIPIVFTLVSDPIGQGLVASLAHPSGNLTGFSNLEPGVGSKWLDLLEKIAPHARRVSVMFNPATSPYNELFQRSIEDAARSINIQTMRAPVHNDAEVEAVFDRLAGAPDNAVLVPSDAFTYFRSAMIVTLAASYRIPAIYAYRRFAADGGLAAYGVDVFDQMRSSASYVDRIVKGAKPGDLPVQQPTKYTLVINLKAATALGLDIPSGVLAIADEVVE